MDNVMARLATERNSKTIWFSLSMLAAIALGYILYQDTFAIWWWVWTGTGSFYAHAVFVPFFVAAMIWRMKDRLEAAPWKHAWSGSILIALAMVMLLIARDSEIKIIQSVSFVLTMFGVVMLLFGGKRTKLMLFPLLFVLTMIPIVPDQIINIIAFPVQLLSTKAAVVLLNALQLHAVRQGTEISTDNYQMAVEGACSGFRTLLSLLTFAGAFAYLIKAETWKKWLLFAVSAPLSLVVNSLRITFIGIVGELISKQAAATFHDYSGFLVLILAFLFLFNFARIIKCEDFLGVPLQDPPPSIPSDSLNNGPRPTLMEDIQGELKVVGSWLKMALDWRPDPRVLGRLIPYILVIDGLFGTAWAMQGRVFKKAPPEFPIATTQVPFTLNSGTTTFKAEKTFSTPIFDRLPKNIQDQLKPTRLINRDYTGSDGSLLNLFMTAGNARWTFHDPHNCSLGSDAVLNDVGILTIPTAKGPVTVLESRFQKNGSKDMYEMMYFYVVDGSQLQTTQAMHKSLLFQTILGTSNHPSYFLRFDQRVPGTDEEKRQQLMHFIAATWEAISPVILNKQHAIEEPPPVPAESDH